MKVVIETKGLVKRYNDTISVNHLNLEVYEGECFGLLGPNGAGKSTTMKMIYGSNLITEGEIYVLGLNLKKNFREVKSRIGIVPEEDHLDIDFTVKENLSLYARYYGLKPPFSNDRIDELLKLMRLDEFADHSVENLSGGMRRRLTLARGLINQPELLILDEPTTGLDPSARLWIWDFIFKMKTELKSILLSTHYMEEAERLCDRVAMMNKGKIFCIGKPEDLIKEHIGIQVVEFEVQLSDVNYYVNRIKEKNYQYQVIRNTISIFLQENDSPNDIMKFITSSKMIFRKPSLNDVFLKISGLDLRNELV